MVQFSVIFWLKNVSYVQLVVCCSSKVPAEHGEDPKVGRVLTQTGSSPLHLVTLCSSLCEQAQRTDLEVAGDALQGDGAALGDHLLLRVQVVREGEAQRDRREEHLDADDEVLVAGRHRAGLLRHVSLLRVQRTDHPRVLQDGQQQSWMG